jgi:hypothetical protein
MKHTITVAVTFEVNADDCTKAEHAVFDAIDAFPLVDGHMTRAEAEREAQAPRLWRKLKSFDVYKGGAYVGSTAAHSKALALKTAKQVFRNQPHEAAYPEMRITVKRTPARKEKVIV